MDDKKAIAVAMISGFMAIASAIISGIFVYQASVGAVREEARITQQAQETAIASSLTAYAPTGPAAVQERIVIVTVVITATPDPAAIVQNPHPQDADLDHIPGVTFSPNAYFIFSILVGVLLIVIFVDVLGRHSLSLSWFLYAAFLGYYIYHLMAAQSPKSYPYQQAFLSLFRDENTPRKRGVFIFRDIVTRCQRALIIHSPCAASCYRRLASARNFCAYQNLSIFD